MRHTIIFDLDDTLYPPSTEIWDRISARIYDYMIRKVGIAENEAEQTHRHYFTTYGTTMRGLMIHHHIDPEEYLTYVHEPSLGQFITANQQLRSMLLNLPQRKIIFTNASRPHAERILKGLGVEDLFHTIIDIMDVQPFCKPMNEAFQIALQKIEAVPQESIFIDDSIHNLDEAKALGLLTIQPNATKTEITSPHIKLASLLDLPAVLSKLSAQ